VAVTAKLYGPVVGSLANKEIDLDSDTIRVALLADTYTPDQDAHNYFDDVSAHEITGTGYTAGGAALTSKVVNYDSATNIFSFDAANTSWSASTITARYAVVYDDTGVDSTSALIGYVDFGENISSTNAIFQITWAAAGIFTFGVT
jgi:hypothetical protein